jgi:Terminase small subunit
MATLNHRQRLFLNYFLGDAKDDAVKAARLAGYRKPESAAPMLLNNRHVAAYLEQKLEESGALPVAEILARLSTIATLDPTEFIEFKEETNKAGESVEKPYIDIKKIKKLHKGHLIKKLKMQPSGAVEMEFHDSVEAMDRLAKYYGMFKERIVIENLNGEANSDRVNLLISIITQQPGAIPIREGDGPVEPGELCSFSEQREMAALSSPEAGEPTPPVD